MRDWPVRWPPYLDNNRRFRRPKKVKYWPQYLEIKNILKGLIFLYTGRIREQLAEQMEQQKVFAQRKAKITNDRNLTAEGKREPLTRIERERVGQAEKAWEKMLDTLQGMKAAEVAPLTAEEATQLAVAAQIVGSLDPKAPEADAALNAILQPFQGRIPAQRVLSSMLRKGGFDERANGLEGRIYDPDEHYNAIAFYVRDAMKQGNLSELNEAFAYLDAIDRNAPKESGSSPIEPRKPGSIPGVSMW